MPIFNYQAQRLDGTVASGEVFAATAELALAQLQRSALQVQELVQQASSITAPPDETLDDTMAMRTRPVQVTDDLIAALRAYSDEGPPGGQRSYFRRWAQQLEKTRPTESNQPATRHDLLLPWVADDPSRSAANAAIVAIRHGQEQLDRTWLFWLPLLYPLSLASIAIAMVLLINMLFRPTYIQLFNDFQLELPVISRIMLTWRGLPITLLCILFLLIIFMSLTRLTGGAIIRPVPWLGRIVRNAQQASFLRRLSAAVAMGRTAQQATCDAADSSHSRSIRQAARRWSETATPADSALRSCDSDFSALARYALEGSHPVAEKARFIRELADDRESAVQDGLFGLSGILEPICLLVVCFIVFLIVVAVYAPLISLIQNLS